MLDVLQVTAVLDLEQLLENSAMGTGAHFEPMVTYLVGALGISDQNFVATDDLMLPWVKDYVRR